MASISKPDIVASKEHKKQMSQHNGIQNDQIAYELQTMDALRTKPVQANHISSSSVTQAGGPVTTANSSKFQSLKKAEPNRDAQSMPKLENIEPRSAPSEPPHIPEKLTILPGQLNGGTLSMPSYGPSIEQRLMQLSSQGLKVEESRPRENLRSNPTKAAEILNQYQQDSITGRESVHSIESNLDSEGDISAGLSDSEAAPTIQDCRVPEDKKVSHYSGSQHYHGEVAIESDVADHRLPLDAALDKGEEDANKTSHLTQSEEPARLSQLAFSEQEDPNTGLPWTLGNLDEAQRQDRTKACILPAIFVDQPTEEVNRPSVPDQLKIVMSSNASRTAQSDRAPLGQKKPTSDYGAMKDILLVYQGQDSASHFGAKREAVPVANYEADQFDTEQQLSKGNTHKRSVAVHLSAGPEHQFNRVKPLSDQSKHCDDPGFNVEIGTKVEDGCGSSQDGGPGEYSMMGSNKESTYSRPASSDIASYYGQKEGDDLRSDQSDNLSDSNTMQEVLDFAESFSNSHLEPDDRSSENLVNSIHWDSERGVLRRTYAKMPFTGPWPESSEHLEGQADLNPYEPQSNAAENRSPSMDRTSGTSGLEESGIAAAEMDEISTCGRDLLSSRYRIPTPPLLFSRRTIVRKHGQRNLLSGSSPIEVESDIGIEGESQLATTVMGPTQPDWESIMEQKSSEDGITAVADTIVHTSPQFEDSEADHSDSDEMSAQPAKQYQTTVNDYDEATSSKHKTNSRYLFTGSDKIGTSPPLDNLNLEDQENSRDPFGDPGSESSACPSTKKAYQHPNPLLFHHVAPLRGSSLLRTSPSLQDLSARSSNPEDLGQVMCSQRYDISPTAVSGSVKGKRPMRTDDVSCHSSLWLSTVEERQSELSSFPSMNGVPTLIRSGQEVCERPSHVRNTRHERNLGAASSSPVLFPSRLNFVTEFSNIQPEPVTSSQTREARNNNEMISDVQGQRNLNFSTMADTSHRRDDKNKKKINVGASTQSSSSNWLHTDKSQRTNSESGTMQRETSLELEDGQFDWSRAYRLYLPPLGPRQVGRGSTSSTGSPFNPRFGTSSRLDATVNLGHDQLKEIENSHGGKIWVTQAKDERSSGGMPNQTYQSGYQRPQGSPSGLFPPPQVHYFRNGQAFTERLPRFEPHPVYGFDCPWDRYPSFARSESPHLYARDALRDTPESRARERVYSVTFAVFCCMTIVLAPFYGHGLLDRVMSYVSRGEFHEFRHEDKVSVLLTTYIILALVVVVLPITMITLSN